MTSTAKRCPFVVLGGGGHAKVVISTLRAAGEEIHAVFDDTESKWGGELLGVPIRGPLVVARDGAWQAILAIGDNAARRRIAEELRLEWGRVVHPAAWVDPSVEIGPGTVVFAGAIVQPSTRLGAHVIVNTGARIDHDGAVGDWAHLAPGTTLAGTVTVGAGAFVGAGATVIPNRTIGEWAIVGAGAAVVRDVAPRTTVVGVPARRIAG